MPFWEGANKQLRLELLSSGARARTWVVGDRRKHPEELVEIDQYVHHRASNLLGTDERKLLACLSSGGTLPNDGLYDMGHVATKMYPHCGEVIQTIENKLWGCQHPGYV